MERFFGYHFTQTRVFVAEAFVNRAKHMQWEVIEQVNYELPAEWLALYKEAIPNLYDTENQVFGFQALPAIWRGFKRDRFHRYDTDFFRDIAKGKIEAKTFDEFKRFLRYTLVYHIKPQPDELLHITLVIEELQEQEAEVIARTLRQQIQLPNVHFVTVISPQEAGLRFIYYEGKSHPDQQRLMLAHLGYSQSEFTPWLHGDVQSPIRTVGARDIDHEIGVHVGKNNPAKRALGMDELAIYALRARADYEQGLDSITIFQQGDDRFAIPENSYLLLIAKKADEIVSRLSSALRARNSQLDEVILAGEGIAFAPLRERITHALDNFQTRQVARPALICAQGAAGYSLELHNAGA